MVNAALSLAGGLAAGLAGEGKPKTLAKMEIIPQPPSKIPPFKVPFNPTSYRISKAVTWQASQSPTDPTEDTGVHRDQNAPQRHFSGGGSRILSFELFFDVTEPVNGVKADVRTETEQIAQLTRIERVTGEPPVCQLVWGDQPLDGKGGFAFKGYVSNLEQSFLLFDSTGIPVRARLNVTFTEFLEPEEDQRQTDPELTTRIVRSGDTLSSIAAEFYRDPGLWRIIAEVNNLDDPRSLKPGQSLSIPDL